MIRLTLISLILLMLNYMWITLPDHTMLSLVFILLNSMWFSLYFYHLFYSTLTPLYSKIIKFLNKPIISPSLSTPHMHPYRYFYRLNL